MKGCQLTKASLPIEQVQKIVTGVQFVFVLQILIAALPRDADVSSYLVHEMCRQCILSLLVSC